MRSTCDPMRLCGNRSYQRLLTKFDGVRCLACFQRRRATASEAGWGNARPAGFGRRRLPARGPEENIQLSMTPPFKVVFRVFYGLLSVLQLGEALLYERSYVCCEGHAAVTHQHVVVTVRCHVYYIIKTAFLETFSPRLNDSPFTLCRIQDVRSRVSIREIQCFRCK